MSEEYKTSNQNAPFFAAAITEFTELVERAGSSDWRVLDHDEVESRIEQEGREVLRLLLEGHMILRGTGKAESCVVGSDGIERSHERLLPRQMGTVLGTITAPRTGYSARGANNLFVVDADLNLPADKHSLHVRRRVAELASETSYDNATEFLQTTTGSTAGKRQVERLVGLASTDFEEFYQQTYLDVDGESTGGLIVLTFDMKGIVLRKEDLRQKTREAASRDIPKSPLDKTPSGLRLNHKRMAMVASVYSVAPWVRTPEQIVEMLQRQRRDDNAEKRPTNEYKRVWASVERTPKLVVAEAFAEALSRDPEQKKSWVILVDGDQKQLKWVQKEARRRRVKAQILLDIIHVAQYLWKAGKVFYPGKDQREDLEKWVAKRLLRVLKGEAGLVAGGMCRSATMRDLDKTVRKPVDKCASYLSNNKKHLRYAQALSAGFPISTGVIEGACRHLIGDRLEITGARWSLEGAEAMLKIRSLRSSGDFEDYWMFHREKQYERNHRRRYANGEHPPLSYPTQFQNLRMVA